jgi:outer membrane receptor for ferrienterochelin and colicins
MKLFLPALLLCCFLSGFAQDRWVVGKVLQQENSEPVVAATISSRAGGKAVLSTSSGQFRISEVVITGTMRAVHRSASPVQVEVYSPQFFRKSSSPSIFDALQLVNGVRPQLN